MGRKGPRFAGDYSRIRPCGMVLFTWSFCYSRLFLGLIWHFEKFYVLLFWQFQFRHIKAVVVCDGPFRPLSLRAAAALVLQSKDAPYYYFSLCSSDKNATLLGVHSCYHQEAPRPALLLLQALISLSHWWRPALKSDHPNKVAVMRHCFTLQARWDWIILVRGGSGQTLILIACPCSLRALTCFCSLLEPTRACAPL